MSSLKLVVFFYSPLADNVIGSVPPLNTGAQVIAHTGKKITASEILIHSEQQLKFIFGNIEDTTRHTPTHTVVHTK